MLGPCYNVLMLCDNFIQHEHYFDVQLIIYVIFQVKMPNIFKFQLLTSEDLLMFFVLCSSKLNICSFCTVGQTKQVI